jgi:hypothetical protein
VFHLSTILPLATQASYFLGPIGMEMEQSKVVDVVFGLSGVFAVFCGNGKL